MYKMVFDHFHFSIEKEGNGTTLFSIPTIAVFHALHPWMHRHSYSMDIQKKREDYKKENIHFSNQIDSHLHKSQLKELNEEV